MKINISLVKKSLVFLSVLSVNSSFAVVNIKNKNKSLTEPFINPDLIYVGKLNGNYIDAAGDYTRTLNLLEDLQNIDTLPMLVFGGSFETDASYSHNTSKHSVSASAGYEHGQNTSDFWIDTARIAMLANFNSFVHAQARINLVSNASIKDATLFFGDLNKSPFYGSIGQEYIHFGDFISDSVYTTPLTYTYFKPSSLHEVSFAAYFDKTLVIKLEAFQGEKTNANSNLDPVLQKYSGQFALYGNYLIPIKNITWNISAGFLNDIRNTQSGLTDLKAVNGGKLPGVDISTLLSFGNWSLGAEYDQLLKNAKDSGGTLVSDKKPAAMHVQGDYTINWKKPINIFASYSHTFGMRNILGSSADSLNNGANKDQYATGVSIGLMDDLTVGLEYANVGQYVWNSKTTPTNNISRYSIVTFDTTLVF